jgi:ferredoxin
MLTSAFRFARSAIPTTNRLTKTSVRTMAAAPAVAPATNAHANGPPSVFDKIVKITIIDPSGARRIIPAMVGQTLYEACDMNGVDLGPSSCGPPQQKTRSSTWTEPLYGEGATSGFDHVLLQAHGAACEGLDMVEPMASNEYKSLRDYWDEDEIFPESRLASQVEINAKMDGLVVYVPDRICDDIP